MSSVKTAISLDPELFERAEAVAREMDISRSRLVALALEEFLRRRESRELLARINEAWEGEDGEERQLTRWASRSHRRLVQGEW